MKYTLSFLLVRGCGRFPIDMLRRDSCVPDSEADSNAIDALCRAYPNALTSAQVVLRRYSDGTSKVDEGRWISFGWRVVAIESSRPAIFEAQFAEEEKIVPKQFSKSVPKPRRRHSRSSQVRCPICAPLRCARAK